LLSIILRNEKLKSLIGDSLLAPFVSGAKEVDTEMKEIESINFKEID